MKSIMVSVNTTCILRCDWLGGRVGVFTKYPSMEHVPKENPHQQNIFTC